MQEQQASGLDTRAMLPVYSCIFMLAAELFLPWFSMPVLKYYDLETAYTLWNLKTGLGNLQYAVESGGKLSMPLLTVSEVAKIQTRISFLQAGAVLSGIFLVAAIAIVLKKKEKSVRFIRISMTVVLFFSIVTMITLIQGNSFLNLKMGRKMNFVNFTIHSYLQLTAYPYAQFMLAIVMIALAGRFLNIKRDFTGVMSRKKKEDKRLGKRTRLAALLIIIGIPSCIFFGIFFLNNRSTTFISLCIIVLSMVPFFMIFEDRKPQARELILIAVMAALAVVGRVAFFMIPQFKPVSAIVIITGVGLGAEAGFLTGAVAGFVSNFFFGQGPWTPWQMFAFGIIGFLAGVLFQGREKRFRSSRIALSIYGGIATFIIYGLIMDTSSLLTFAGDFKWETLLAIYISGIPFNFIHGVSTIVFLFVLAKPMEMKLERIKKKYGILEV